MQVVVLDGYTLNPGDNPWDPITAQAETVVHDRTPVDQIEEGLGRLKDWAEA
jgi:glycerate dehydrogenase